MAALKHRLVRLVAVRTFGPGSSSALGICWKMKSLKTTKDFAYMLGKIQAPKAPCEARPEVFTTLAWALADTPRRMPRPPRPARRGEGGTSESRPQVFRTLAWALADTPRRMPRPPALRRRLLHHARRAQTPILYPRLVVKSTGFHDIYTHPSRWDAPTTQSTSLHQILIQP